MDMNAEQELTDFLVKGSCRRLSTTLNIWRKHTLQIYSFLLSISSDYNLSIFLELILVT